MLSWWRGGSNSRVVASNLTRIKIINYEKTQTNEHDKNIATTKPCACATGLKSPRSVAGGGVNQILSMKRILVACRHDGMDNH